MLHRSLINDKVLVAELSPVSHHSSRSPGPVSHCVLNCRQPLRKIGLNLNVRTSLNSLQQLGSCSSSRSNSSTGAASAISRSCAGSCEQSTSHEQQPEMCVIVDEHNRIVGHATRRETVSKRLLGRGSYVLVFNTDGHLFVSKRSNSKDCYPGCLDVTISGVVNQCEEYIDTAVRELQEEVSVPAAHSRRLLQQLFIFPYQDDVCHVFGCAFKLTWDGPMAFADAEVEWGRFMALQELQQLLREVPQQFTPVGRHILQLYLQKDTAQQQQQQQSDNQGSDASVSVISSSA